MKKSDLHILFVLLISISAFTCKGQTSCPPLVWFKLDGNAIDSSGNGNNGWLHGTTPAVDRYSNAGSALFFNGSSDYIECNSAFDYPQRTISFWFKVDAFLPTATFLYNSDNNQILYGATAIILYDSLGTDRINFIVGSNHFVTTILPNTWYHLALVDNSTTIKCFINGNLSGSFPASLVHSPNGSVVANIGCSRSPDRFFTGSADEVKIYDCALTDVEIGQLYSGIGFNEFTNESIPISIYPNPANDNLTVEINQKAKIEIINIKGQIIKRIIATENHTTFDISVLTKGMYFIKALTEKDIVTKKFIKE